MRFETHPTPNPNSLKIIRADGGAMMAPGMKSFTSFAEAAADPLGILLFSIEGVTGVFALPAFVTLTKRPDASWDTILPAAEAALAEIVLPG